MTTATPPDRETRRERDLLAAAEERYVETRDGVRLHYEVFGRRDAEAQPLLVANGLGARIHAWLPLIERLADTHRIITWDYRGLYASGVPARRKALAIPRHAEDAVALLDAEGVGSASLAGWSMGVQVALEAAAEFPERFGRLVLINGTHGHALETGFQPLFRVPWLSQAVHRLIEHALVSPRLVAAVRRIAQSEVNIRGVGGLVGRLQRNPRIEEVYRRYVDDVFGPSLRSWLLLFLEVNAHSVYHLLPEIEQPTLVVSGGLDPLTPAYQSAEIARRMPNAEHLHIRLGSHFVLLEREREVADRIAAFLVAH